MGSIKNLKKKSPTSVQVTEKTIEKSRIDQGIFVYELVNEWIKNADNKVSISCAVFTGVFGVISYLTDRHINVHDNPAIDECFLLIYKYGIILSLAVLAAAVFCYAKAIIPNLKSAGNPTKKLYPIYYGDIKSLELEDYKQRMARSTEKDLFDELAIETWHNSRICLKKMRWYKAGVILSLSAIVIAIIPFITYLVRFM